MINQKNKFASPKKVIVLEPASIEEDSKTIEINSWNDLNPYIYVNGLNEDDTNEYLDSLQ